MTGRCYYDTLDCEGELWQCKNCRTWYCQTHWHETELGRNVKCVACERVRVVNKPQNNF